MDDVIAHLCTAGLTTDEAKAVCDGAGVTTISDLALLQDDVSAVASAAGLKLVATKKLAIAVNLAVGVSAASGPPPPAAALPTTVDASVSAPSPYLAAPAAPAAAPALATAEKTHDDGTMANPAATDATSSSSSPADAAASAATAAAAGPVLEECVAIAIDRSGSMGSPFDEMRAWNDDGNTRALTHSVQQRSRMEAVKQVFYAFRDRTATVGGGPAGSGSHMLGLLQFDDKVERMMEPSADLDVFEAVVDSMEKRGSTAIYSAIIEATHMLAPTFRAHPHADLRVLVLTDGQSNRGASPQEALVAALEIGAVVDAIIVGDQPDAMLRKIVGATGGSCYQIKSLSEGFELMEAEAVVSLRARRGGTDKPPPHVSAAARKAMMTPAKIAEALGAPVAALVRGGDATKAAAQAAPVRARATKVMACGALCGDRDAAAKAVQAAEAAAAAGAGPGLSRGATMRVMKELTAVAKGTAWQHGGGGIHVFPDGDNLALMRVLIEGPAGSPFEDGLFALHVTVPAEYPFRAPRVEFETPVYHCNVSDSGAICLEELQSGWNPSLTVPRVLEAVRAMLAHPSTDSALRQWIAELTIASRNSAGADTRYVEAARAATKRDAAATLEEYRARWGVA
jgi:ubiquitin-protein ligase